MSEVNVSPFVSPVELGDNGVYAIDFASLAGGLDALQQYTGVPLDLPTEHQARPLIDLCKGLAFQELVDSGIITVGAGGPDEVEKLNKMAENAGFKPPFEGELAPGDAVVLSLMKAEMKWFEDNAWPSTMDVKSRVGSDEIVAVSFDPDFRSTTAYDIHDSRLSQPVVRVKADPSKRQDGSQLQFWATEITHGSSVTPIDLFRGAASIALACRHAVPIYGKSIESIQVPKIDVQHSPGLALSGLVYADGLRKISRARQVVKTTVDELGAVFSAETDLFDMTLGSSDEEAKRKIRLGATGRVLSWATLEDSGMPLGVTLTDLRAWERPLDPFDLSICR